ncbi:chromate transporter [Tepidibacillus decaturensis]|uniref:Chromate transporter n=1 Tax=Tepidibacillus decaturensis TaxID=1413211 RepID=A0A135L6L6_9BACI|nr:chromate transporter [Tepidibacillus decaturensis]KXG44616.1 chromate transporter [Tepidibacillus decaturensis]
MLHLDIFIAFFRSGMLGFGGGPSSIPLVHKEVVERFKWMDDDEFADVLALGNTLPGPIATKMAGYIGYRMAGIPGMFNALLASILPTILLMIVFLTSLNTFKDQAWVKGMTRGVVPVVAMMMITLTWDFVKKSKQHLGWFASILMIIASYLLLEILNVHPAILIVILLLAAVLKRDPKSVKEGGSAK